MEERASGIVGNREVEEAGITSKKKKNGGSGIREEIYSDLRGKIEKKRSGFYHESLVGLVQLGEVELRNVRLPLLTFSVCYLLRL